MFKFRRLKALTMPVVTVWSRPNGLPMARTVSPTFRLPLESAVAYLTHPLNAYDNNPVWKSDPKLSMLKDAARRTLTAGGQGSVGEKAASALADFVVLDMVASVCTDRASIKDAIAVAERQAKRIYR
jgi:multiple sugar transport system substrate-binding protein